MRASQSELEHWLPPSLAKKFNFLIINKTDLDFRGRQPGFDRSFTRDLRLADANETLKKLVPADDKIFLIGYSEGAYLAPELALLDNRVKAIGMLSGGTRSWLEEELKHASSQETEEVQKHIDLIRLQPNDVTRKWRGFSYLTWASYDNNRTIEALRNLRIPVQVFLGARDRLVDTVSALEDMLELNDSVPLDVEVLMDCGHFLCKQQLQIRRQLGDLWLSTGDVQKSASNNNFAESQKFGLVQT